MPKFVLWICHMWIYRSKILLEAIFKFKRHYSTIFMTITIHVHSRTYYLSITWNVQYSNSQIHTTIPPLTSSTIIYKNYHKKSTLQLRSPYFDCVKKFKLSNTKNSNMPKTKLSTKSESPKKDNSSTWTINTLHYTTIHLMVTQFAINSTTKFHKSTTTQFPTYISVLTVYGPLVAFPPPSPTTFNGL